MKPKHAEKRKKITISLWLFVTIIVLFVLLIVGITVFSVYNELNPDNKNGAAPAVTQTEEKSTETSSAKVTESTDAQGTQNSLTEQDDTEQPTTEDTTTQPSTEDNTENSTESIVANACFTAEMYPYKAFDTVGNRNAPVKEVFGSIYSGEGFTFDENGYFCDDINQSGYNFGVYTVTDGVINMNYSSDKKATAHIISYQDGAPSEMVIDYVGYEVYFKVGSAD